MRYDFYRATLTSKIQRASIALVLLVASLYPAGAFIFNLSRNGAEAIASISHIAPDTGPIAGGTTVTLTGTNIIPATYVQDGLQLQYDAINNTGTGSHNTITTTWKDLSGHGNDGTVVTSTGWGWTSKSLHFGTTTSLTTPYKPPDQSPWTAEITYKNVASLDTASDIKTFFGGTYRGGDQRGFQFAAGLYDGNPYSARVFSRMGGGDAGTSTVMRILPAQTGAYDTVTAVNPQLATNNVWDGYQNGSYRSSAADISGGIHDNTFAYNATLLYQTHGDISAIRIYNRALSAAEVCQNAWADFARFGGAAPSCVPVSVTFDNLSATNVSVVDNGDGTQTVTATAPSHPSGLVDVVVDNGIDTVTLNNAYTYYAPITTTSLTPNHGLTTGNTSVTVTGNNFSSPAPTTPTVTFDTGAGAVQGTVTAWTDTSITVTTPAHVAGLVSVTVNNGVDTITIPAAYTNPSGNLTDPANVSSGFLYQEPYLTMGVSSNNPTVNITPTGSNNQASAQNTATVSTNNPTGYSLSISMAATGPNDAQGNPTCKANSNHLVHTDGTTTLVGSTNPWVAGGAASTPLANGAWGYNLNGSTTNFIGAPQCGTYQALKTTSAANEPGDVTTITYGANVANNQKSGTYSGTIVYMAVKGV